MKLTFLGLTWGLLLFSMPAMGAPPLIFTAEIDPPSDRAKSATEFRLRVEGDNLESVNEVYLDSLKLVVTGIDKNIDEEGTDRVFARVPLSASPGLVTVVTPRGRATFRDVVDVPVICLATELKVEAKGGSLDASVTFRNGTSKPCAYSSELFAKDGAFSQGFEIVDSEDPKVTFRHMSYYSDNAVGMKVGNTKKSLAPGESFTVTQTLNENYFLPSKGRKLAIVHNFPDLPGAWNVRSNRVTVTMPATPPQIRDVELFYDMNPDKKCDEARLCVEGDNLGVVDEVFLGSVKLKVERTGKGAYVNEIGRVCAAVAMNSPSGKVTVSTPGGTAVTSAVLEVPVVCLEKDLKVESTKVSLEASVTFRNRTKRSCRYYSSEFLVAESTFARGFEIKDAADPANKFPFISKDENGADLPISIDPKTIIPQEEDRVLGPGESFTVKQDLSKTYALPAKGKKVTIVHVSSDFSSPWNVCSNAVTLAVP